MVPRRREDAARAIARFGPDLDALIDRLSRDSRMPFYRRLPIRGVATYLRLRDAVVPDWVPFVRRFDDAAHSALVLRFMLRGSNEEMLREAWPGPDATLRVFLVAAGLAEAAPKPRLPFWR